MYRNYTTSNIFDYDNYKNDYSYKTCNTSFLMMIHLKYSLMVKINIMMKI